jgi:hypothetical protein
MSECYIGRRRFVDGEFRTAYEDELGQFVLDDDGEPVYGVWLAADEQVDEPITVPVTSLFGSSADLRTDEQVDEPITVPVIP